ncbi:MAG: DUF1566 domain-containing protein [Parafilimonas sp.]|nr:DUF1566 domain-containing protein [Parafilimonas sp.]
MKTPFKAIFAAMLALAVSCTKQSTVIRSSSVSQSTAATPTFTIGQHYGGGIIFYIDATGEHGLIADEFDLTPSAWDNGTFITTGATATAVGTGALNTKTIVQAQGKPGNYAALRCWKLDNNGYTDWFLPSMQELDKLFQQKDVVGNFSVGENDYYWSSSEVNNRKAYEILFFDGILFKQIKGAKRHVRAIRAF